MLLEYKRQKASFDRCIHHQSVPCSQIVNTGNETNLYYTHQDESIIKPRFNSSEKIIAARNDKRYKINVRNTLGVKDHTNWIYNLNIANVMNMTPMNSDELSLSSATDKQSDLF
jgi:hypothetical protein